MSAEYAGRSDRFFHQSITSLLKTKHILKVNQQSVERETLTLIKSTVGLITTQLFAIKRGFEEFIYLFQRDKKKAYYTYY